MKLDEEGRLDDIDSQILRLLQDDCKISLARIGQAVGLSAPSVVERIRKLEHGGVIRGYHAVVDARRVGLDVTAFIGVCIGHPRLIGEFEREVEGLPDVLECHHVTGAYTVLVKVKTRNTATLEKLLSRIRSLDGVQRTETMVVLSTHTERVQVALDREVPASAGRPRRNGSRARSPSAA
jgi:Lrp/AsnC family leucine-responsive transcriptional regulator